MHIYNYRVPEDQTGPGRQWLSFLKLANSQFIGWKPTKKAIFICSRHFKNSDFRFSATTKRFVRDGCYPCIDNGVDLSEKVILITSHTYYLTLKNKLIMVLSFRFVTVLVKQWNNLNMEMQPNLLDKES